MSTTLVGIGTRSDPSEAIELGRRLAEARGAGLTLARVFPFDDFPVPVGIPTLADELRSEALEQVRAVAREVRAGVPIEVAAIGRGSAARGLHDLALDSDAAVVVIGPSHHGRAGRMFLAGTAHRLLHGSPCPVAIAPAGYHAASPDLASAVVAFDGSVEAEAALAFAAGLAGTLKSGLTLLGVVAPLTVGSAWSAYGVADVQERRHAALRAVLDRAAERVARRVAVTVRLQDGFPGHMLADASRTCDLLVCGSRGYGPVGTVLLGSVSQHLADHAACPLIVVPRAHGRARERTEHPAEAISP